MPHTRVNARLPAGAIALFFCLSAAATDPGILVDEFHAALIRTVQTPGDYAARYRELEKPVTGSFDVATISRIALGRHWRELTADQQATVAGAMTELLVSTYAARFDHFDNQVFQRLESVPLAGGRVQVKTQLTTGQGEVVELDYQLNRRDGRWRIYDIVANGVSDLSLKRTMYSRAFDQGGFAGVISEIRAGIADPES
jgi:phospholipid transport system substrate-binding protein